MQHPNYENKARLAIVEHFQGIFPADNFVKRRP